MFKYLILICLFGAFSLVACAQKPDTTTANIKHTTDTLKATKADTDVVRQFKPKHRKEKVFHPDSLHSPHTAVIRSLIVPGLGQIYNRKYWKVPIIYGGLGLLFWAEIFNNTYYQEFLAISKYREHGVLPGPKDPYYADYNLYVAQPDQALYDATDAYRRNRDLSILGIFGAWGINAIDAYIDAKFMHSYTVDTNLSVRVSPGMITQPLFVQNGIGSFIPSLKITFAF